MKCALCLAFNEFPIPGEAITIVNGQAVCSVHFDVAARWETADAGPVAIKHLLERTTPRP